MGSTNTRHIDGKGTKLLDGVALNAGSAADRTVTVNLPPNGAKVCLLVELTRTAATTVDIAVQVSMDGTTYVPLQSGAISGGTRTLSDFTDSKTVSGNDEFGVEYDLRGWRHANFVFSGTSAGGSDTVDVYGTVYEEA